MTMQPEPQRLPAPGPQATGEIAGEEFRDQRLARLVRVLGVSGRRLVDCAGCWRVMARGDRRRRAWMATFSNEEVERLKHEGRIVASQGAYVLAPGNEGKNPAPHNPPAAGPWVFEAAGVGASRLGGPGFAGYAMKARRGRGPLTLRQAMAGLRLIEDAEQAGRDPALTMNWDAVPTDRQARAKAGAVRSPRVRAAEQRLRRTRSALGPDAFALVWAVCVERTPMRVMQQRLGLGRVATRNAFVRALENVADAYDG